ncbi:MAG: GC-type dockerin domain-anchored protein [Phycisphaerales bacterium JB052]
MQSPIRQSALLKKSGLVCGITVGASFAALALAGGGGSLPVPTTLNDFALPGTQTGGLNPKHPIVGADSCASCHGFYDSEHDPYSTWSASMMGQSMRDPIFLAAMTIANQDADFAGALCIRCHAPSAFLEGRHVPTDGSALSDIDKMGVSCNFCHRMVDPVYEAGVSPLVDNQIIMDLGSDAPTVAQTHTAAFIVDPEDRRRGPYDEGPDFFYHQWEQSPFHQESQMCASCHDVSNPIYSAQPDGSYTLNDLDAAHPTGNVYETFPEQRTYSEWLMSDFAQAPIAIGDRYETQLNEVSSCQDCHMPELESPACLFEDDRPNYSNHAFSGSNNWVLRAIRSMNTNDFVTGLLPELVDQAIDRNEDMMRAASDMELSIVDNNLNVRIINQSGHKLPTGYPEGRRMWINVKFFDETGALLAEHGAYDDATAELTTSDTKVYEMKIGLDAHASALTGIPEGPSFHLTLANKVFKDNRIPPRGFTNANFESIQSAPVDYSYDDGDFWDDTQFVIPKGAASAEARVRYQLTSKEYIEFLRDENTTNTAGQDIYDQWVAHGKSPVIDMDEGTIEIALPCPADLTGDGNLDFFDVSAFLGAFSNMQPEADFTGDGLYNFFDVSAFLNAFSAGCP